MKKRILSAAVIMMMALSVMPVCKVNAADYTESFTLPSNWTEQINVTSGNVTLDLAGYNLTVSGKSAIVVQKNATLTITDSGHKASDGTTMVYGTVEATGNGDAAVAALPGSTVNINGGTYKTSRTFALFKISADLTPEYQILYSRNDIHHYHIGKR